MASSVSLGFCNAPSSNLVTNLYSGNIQGTFSVI
jgi:hypothetical protein